MKRWHGPLINISADKSRPLRRSFNHAAETLTVDKVVLILPSECVHFEKCGMYASGSGPSQ